MFNEMKGVTIIIGILQVIFFYKLFLKNKELIKKDDHFLGCVCLLENV